MHPEMSRSSTTSARSASLRATRWTSRREASAASPMWAPRTLRTRRRPPAFFPSAEDGGLRRSPDGPRDLREVARRRVHLLLLPVGRNPGQPQRDHLAGEGGRPRLRPLVEIVGVVKVRKDGRGWVVRLDLQERLVVTDGPEQGAQRVSLLDTLRGKESLAVLIASECAADAIDSVAQLV